MAIKAPCRIYASPHSTPPMCFACQDFLRASCFALGGGLFRPSPKIANGSMRLHDAPASPAAWRLLYRKCASIFAVTNNTKFFHFSLSHSCSIKKCKFRHNYNAMHISRQWSAAAVDKARAFIMLITVFSFSFPISTASFSSSAAITPPRR